MQGRCKRGKRGVKYRGDGERLISFLQRAISEVDDRLFLERPRIPTKRASAIHLSLPLSPHRSHHFSTLQSDNVHRT